MIGLNLEIEKCRDRIIDMVLDLLIEIENGDAELLNIEKLWLPDTIGLEKVILTYRKKRVPDTEFTFITMQRNGMV